jgi:hypothetical protein
MNDNNNIKAINKLPNIKYKYKTNKKNKFWELLPWCLKGTDANITTNPL